MLPGPGIPQKPEWLRWLTMNLKSFWIEKYLHWLFCVISCWHCFIGWVHFSIAVGVVRVGVGVGVIACHISITIAIHCFHPNSMRVWVQYRRIQYPYSQYIGTVGWCAGQQCTVLMSLDSIIQCWCTGQQHTVLIPLHSAQCQKIHTVLSSAWSYPDLSKYILCTVRIILYHYVTVLYHNCTGLYKWGPICTAVATVANCSQQYSSAQGLRVLLMQSFIVHATHVSHRKMKRSRNIALIKLKQ